MKYLKADSLLMCFLKVIIKIVKEKNGIIESKGEIFFNKEKISNGIFKFINPKIFKINVK